MGSSKAHCLEPSHQRARAPKTQASILLVPQWKVRGHMWTTGSTSAPVMDHRKIGSRDVLRCGRRTSGRIIEVEICTLWSEYTPPLSSIQQRNFSFLQCDFSSRAFTSLINSPMKSWTDYKSKSLWLSPPKMPDFYSKSCRSKWSSKIWFRCPL